MKTRIITAILILLCVIPPLLFGGWLINCLIAFIIIAGGIELMDLKELDNKWPAGIKLLSIASVFLILLSNKELQLPLLGVCSLLLLSIPIFTDHFHSKDSFLCIAYITLFFTIASGFINIYTNNPMYVWYIIIATYTCDSAAYFCGRFLGKHKLNERISPKKTWEGAIGGWVIGSLLSFAFAYFMIDSSKVIQFLIASGILTISGQIGDLAFSAIKRNFGIKDFSNLLPGHGGVLDRIDSLVFNFIIFNFILVVMVL